MTDPRHLFQDVLLDHYRHPRHTAPLSRPLVVVEQAHRACGDRVRVELSLDEAARVVPAILTRGCAVSTAAGSLLAEWVAGRDAGQALEGLNMFRDALEHGRLPRQAPPPALAFRSIHAFPVRRGCALLPLEALARALARVAEPPVAPRARRQDNI